MLASLMNPFAKKKDEEIMVPENLSKAEQKQIRDIVEKREEMEMCQKVHSNQFHFRECSQMASAE